jgi:hypothetical protein
MFILKTAPAQRAKHQTIQRASILRKMDYLSWVKPISQPRPIEPEKLKPALHDKIERMDGLHLSLLNRVMQQLEAEELAGRLGEGFDKDYEQGLLGRIPELVRQFRDEHPYA